MSTEEAERPGDREASLRGGATSAGDAVAALIMGLGSQLRRDRVWLAADDGTIWMYSPAAGFQEIAGVFRTSTEGPPGVAVSGRCR
jgi:hypothetical protein